MKKNKIIQKEITDHGKRLFRAIDVLLEEDLMDPSTETVAREVLAEIRAHGFPLPDLDLDDPGCIPCLHLTLMSASELGRKIAAKQQLRDGLH